MFKNFYPTVYAESAYTVDFKKYFDMGYRHIILDVDNTIVGHGAPCDEKAVGFFDNLRSIGFDTCILSNNSEERVKPFADGVKSAFISHGKKPSSAGYIKAMELLGGNRDNTLFIGDQMFTDVFGANRSNIKSILVKPVGKDWEFQILLKRAGEKIVMPFYMSYAKKHESEL